MLGAGSLTQIMKYSALCNKYLEAFQLDFILVHDLPGNIEDPYEVNITIEVL